MDRLSDLSTVMRLICAALEKPVIVVLLFLLGATVVLLGSLIAEAITEHRHLKIWMPHMIETIRRNNQDIVKLIMKSGLLVRQKVALIEVASRSNFSDPMREALAVRMIDAEAERYDNIVKLSDLVVRLGPVFGLLGTLIPLGPGIIALGQGDTYTLSQSLLTAFDTTTIGLVCAGICTVISSIRKRWYRDYMSILETLMDCVLEVKSQDADEQIQ